jgi:hypothetical protein
MRGNKRPRVELLFYSFGILECAWLEVRVLAPIPKLLGRYHGESQLPAEIPDKVVSTMPSRGIGRIVPCAEFVDEHPFPMEQSEDVVSEST